MNKRNLCNRKCWRLYRNVWRKRLVRGFNL